MVRTSLTAMAVAAVLFAACSDNSTGTGDDQSPAGTSTGFEGCKSLLTTHAAGRDATDQACLEYVYDGESVLQLRHVNAVFNCCPDSVGGAIQIEDHNITIDEAEWLSNPCDCICPFDVDYEIINLPPGTYTIWVNEMYLREGAEILEFTVDLVENPSGSFCVERDIPQTDTPDTDANPSGQLTDYTACKSSEAAASREETADSLDCLEYDYDGQSVLRLKHVNAGFNCCPDSLIAVFHISVGEITIDESELLITACHCLCLYDLDYEITGIEPGEYGIRIKQPYLANGDAVLEFTMDLTSARIGTFCVTRTFYPWTTK